MFCLGGLDQLIYVPLPDEESRVDILKCASRKMPLAPVKFFIFKVIQVYLYCQVIVNN